jgi:membrane fusion protein, multidrug efflux system
MTDTVLERVAVPISTTRNRRLRFKRLAPAALGLLIAIGGMKYGYDWWRGGRFIETTDDAYAGGDITPVSPHVAGFISEILVADNQRVAAGQLLIRIDLRDFRAALDHARALADERQATLTSLEAKYVLQQQMVAQAQADLGAKTAKASFASADATRYRNLAKTGYGTQQSAERTSAADQEAQSTIKAAEATLAAARQQLTVLQADIAAARASVAQAKADLETARLNLGYTEIRSPIDGVIGNRSARAGAYATVGAQLLSIVPAHGLWVDANFKESQLAQMSVGQRVEITADVLPGRRFRGRIASLAPATGAQFSVIPPENATGNFTKIVQRVPVRIVLEDDAAELGTLRPGLSVVARVDQRRSADIREAHR